MFGKLNRLVQVAKTANKASKGFKTTRRNFMKGLGSLALSSALPGGMKVLPNVKAQTLGKLPLVKTPPWIKSMIGVLDNTYNTHKTKGINVTKHGDSAITHYSSPNPKAGQTFEIKTPEGQTEMVTMKKTKNDIELRWPDANGERQDRVIIINKKDGKTELINEIETWDSGPDPKAIYDESDRWNISKDKLLGQIHHNVDASFTKLDDVDPALYDEYSVYLPDAGTGADELEMFFEKYVNSFSPSGAIFKAPEKMTANYKFKEMEKMRKNKEAFKKFDENRRAAKKLDDFFKKETDELDWESQFRGGTLHGYNIGGIVNKLKTVGSLTKGLKAAEPLGPISKGQMKLAAPKGPYSIADESGVRVLDKDFDTVEDAQKALQELSSLRLSDPSKFKIFGARPPKTKEGISYGAPEVKAVSKQDEARMPAMFWKSREEIAEANQNVMTGKQWLAYLKNKGVGDTELKDTSLGYHLMSTPNAKIKKSELLLEFDEIAPQIDAKVLGWRDTNALVKDARSFIDSIRRHPPVYMDQKSRRIINNIYPEMSRMKEIPTGPQMVRLKDIVNKSFKDEFGIDQIIGKGLDPAKQMPFMSKKLALVFDDILNQKGIQYTASGKPKHAGDQTMSGGQNYQEILFSYKPGTYRQKEKIFTEGHDFGGQSPDNMFVWVRFSDRNDEFGRKILFVEEIQSDMHQGARGKRHSPGKGYVPRKDLYDPDSLEVSKIETALAKIQDKIDEAGGLNVGPLRAQQAQLIKKSKQLKPGKKRYKSGSNIPEGPFADSKDYGRFIMQYLLRAAKESGDYDGVALASGKIKGSDKTGFYTNIMIPQMKKISKKTGAKFDETVIVDGQGVPQDGIPVLLLKDKKGIIPTTQKMDSGISSYNTGGLVRDAFEPIVSPLT
jgi:hypothetical protein